jgi:hypothetical protein
MDDVSEGKSRRGVDGRKEKPTGRAAPRLRGAAILNGGGLVSRSGGIVFAEADQDLIGRILQPRVGFVQLARGLRSQLAKLIPVSHMGKRPKN